MNNIYLVPKDELYHYGIKGMKWGVRRIKDENGQLVLSKGTTVKRVSDNIEDVTYDNKKYVSINQDDHDKWQQYIGEAYVRRNRTTWTQTYVTTKDLKVMSSTKQGEMYAKMLMDTSFAEKAVRDTEYANKSLRLKNVDDLSENISRNIAMQTSTGKKFVEAAIKEGYEALIDTHGTNVSESPVIILNPDKNLKKSANAEYTQPVKDFLRQYGVIV